MIEREPSVIFVVSLFLALAVGIVIGAAVTDEQDIVRQQSVIIEGLQQALDRQAVTMETQSTKLEKMEQRLENEWSARVQLIQAMAGEQLARTPVTVVRWRAEASQQERTTSRWLAALGLKVQTVDAVSAQHKKSDYGTMLAQTVTGHMQPQPVFEATADQNPVVVVALTPADPDWVERTPAFTAFAETVKKSGVALIVAGGSEPAPQQQTQIVLEMLAVQNGPVRDAQDAQR